ncbi:PaaI family thioesterase [Pueribacillus sp. YX66]|uniref:PaaI family thioesterase n=1 Tax=Pueribacillus sp. YX66 TaxID=3229242 RepID=UPI00358CFBE1
MKKALQQREEDLMLKNHFRQFIGVQIEEINEGTAVIALPFNEKLLQSANMIHGGVLSVLIDSVIGTAIRSVLNDDTFAVTAEMNVNYFRPAMKGTIRAKGKVINKGRSLVVGSADIFSEDGKLLATGRATYAIKEKKQKKNRTGGIIWQKN